jgi:hypothetical protein
MQRLFVLTLAASTLFPSALRAQFSEFAVTDDGRLYFTTTLRTGGEDARSKVYRVTGEGLSLYATGGDYSNAISGRTAGQPLVSGDGSIIGHALYTPCVGSCMIYIPRTNFYLQGTGFPSITASTLQVSRNGRFLLASVFVPATLRFEEPLIIELPPQRRRALPQFMVAASPRQAIANDGSIVFRSEPSTKPLVFAPLDAPGRDIAGTEGAVSAIISPNGDLVAYERDTATGHELILTNPQGTTHRVLATSAPGASFQPSFANDGTLLYLDPESQPMLLAPGSEPRQLITLDGGAHKAIISGNGQLVWLGTSAGQLLRVRTIDNVADEVIPATPLLTTRFLYSYPGSVVRLRGIGLSPDTQVTLGDVPLVLADFSTAESVYQLPWEYAPSGASPKFVVRGTGSPFRQEYPAFDLTSAQKHSPTGL